MDPAQILGNFRHLFVLSRQNSQQLRRLSLACAALDGRPGA
jgi:hypothetical protein